MSRKTVPKKLLDVNIAKYYLLTLSLSFPDKKGEAFTYPKKGKEKYHAANVNLYYWHNCLKGYDGKFRLESVVVLKETINRLPKSAS